MHVSVIDEFSRLNALRRNWDAVYEADPEAQFFLSWQWLFDYLTLFPTVWFVLGAKRKETDTEYVAFLPMRMLAGFDKKHGFFNELIFAGVALSDYGGILARPECEAEAVPALAEYVKRRLNWARFAMENLMMSDQRRRLFLGAFDKRHFSHTAVEHKYPNDPTNYSICPAIKLPTSWDAYLGTLSPNNRQKIRRLLKKLDASADYRITLSDAESFDQNLTMLLDFWEKKWAPLKGEKRAHDLARNNHAMSARCAKNGTLLLPVFWQGDRPVAALAILIDACKRSLLFFVTGRDETYREVPAGYLLHAYSIRYAIAHGFATYDFLRGDEPYKYLFAPRERRIRGVRVVTKNNRNLGGKLDPRGLPAMLDMVLGFENQGEAGDAERGYRQILEMEPDHALALYRFGRFMAKSGAHAEAKELLSRSVKAEPEGGNAWLLLARSLQSLGEHEPALEACRQVIRIRPQDEDAKTLIVELSSTATPAGQSATVAASRIKAPDRTPAPRQPPAQAAPADPYWDRVQQLAAASVDPNWVERQLAAQAIAPARRARWRS